ncbi:MAG: hypothetical protein WCG81_10155 [Candidatus Angelobacter sp.]
MLSQLPIMNSHEASRAVPVVAMQAFSKQTVGVGSNILSSPNWKSFPDFLWDYVPFTFGTEWSKSESETGTLGTGLITI